MTLAELHARLIQMLAAGTDVNSIVMVELAALSPASDPIPCKIEGTDVESHPDGGAGPQTVWITVAEDA